MAHQWFQGGVRMLPRDDLLARMQDRFGDRVSVCCECWSGGESQGRGAAVKGKKKMV